LRNEAQSDVMSITKIVARPRRNAVLSWPETPKKGQRPRK
jgi:hypothetical protein